MEGKKDGEGNFWQRTSLIDVREAEPEKTELVMLDRAGMQASVRMPVDLRDSSCVGSRMTVDVSADPFGCPSEIGVDADSVVVVVIVVADVEQHCIKTDFSLHISLQIEGRSRRTAPNFRMGGCSRVMAALGSRAWEERERG